MKGCLRIARLVVAAIVCVLAAPTWSDEHEVNPSARSSLNQLLEQVRAARREGGALNREREAAFLARRDERRRLLDEEKTRLERLTHESERLEETFNKNERELMELETLYRQRTGGFGDLPEVFRRAAADLETRFANSVAAFGIEGWREPLAGMRARKSLPTTEQLDDLLLLLLELMTMQATNARFEADVVSPAGKTERRRVVRVGPFTATADGDFLSYLPGRDVERGRLIQLARRPASRFVSAAETFARAESGFSAAPIDPSRGSVLALLMRSPTLAERIEQGGVVGLFILLIGVIGLALGGERLWFLFRTVRAVEAQSRDVGNPGDNPLGRVIAACAPRDIGEDADYEALELRVDDAVMREIPPLERGLGTMKMFAAIAPLLGLLGTVVGMIETFQAVTLFGTGDPKLMAGGISMALVTTALGLIVAVPILLLHTLARARSRAIREILEAQGAGLLAGYVESRSR